MGCFCLSDGWKKVWKISKQIRLPELIVHLRLFIINLISFMQNVNIAVNIGHYVLSATPSVSMNELWNATFNTNKDTFRFWTLAGMSQPVILIWVYWLGGGSFGCANIHNGLICCEQAGAVSNCYSTSWTTKTTQSSMGGWVVQVIMWSLKPLVEVRLRLGCDNRILRI